MGTNDEVVFPLEALFYFLVLEWNRTTNTEERCVYGPILELMGEGESKYRRVRRVIILVPLCEGWKMEDISIM